MTIREEFEKAFVVEFGVGLDAGVIRAGIGEVALFSAKWMADKMIKFVDEQTSNRNFCEHVDSSDTLGIELRQLAKGLEEVK